jgi:CubicO group peptidase (beta-lactamase class C family)
MTARPRNSLIATGLLAAGLALGSPAARAASQTQAIDSYVRGYADGGNFSGVVRVERDGKLVFERAYGDADRARKVANTPATQFHIASMSMQFTAAAVMRLVDKGDLALDAPASTVVDGLSWGDGVTVRHLLMERSGLPDINARDDYNDILQKPQTPKSLVAYVAGQPLQFKPGEKFLREEHSAYNLLALIVETKAKKPFAAAVEELVFQPLGLREAAIDDDRPLRGAVARGYQVTGVVGVEPAPPIHWSAKAGNASVTLSARDEAKWVRALFSGGFLSPASREAVLSPAERVGFGWFKSQSKRFGELAYSMNGRSPGFASYLLYLPKERLTVVALSNIYSSSTTQLGEDVAALALGQPVKPFQPWAGKVTVAEAPLSFHFGSDFYRPNADLRLEAADGGWTLRWPGDSFDALIPVGPDRFVDRAYWQDVTLKRDAQGRLTSLVYDRFTGVPAPASAPAPRD